MKRILFVDHTPFVGGAELALAEHLRHLDRRRFTPLVACTADVPSLVDLYRDRGAEVHVTTLPRLNAARLDVVPGFLHAVLQFRRLVARERVDLVVSNSARTAYIASAALVAPRTPLVWWVRDFLYGRALFRQAKRVPRRIVWSDASRLARP